MKKKLSTAKILTGEHIIGLKKKPGSKYSEAELFKKQASKRKKGSVKLQFPNGGTATDYTEPKKEPVKTYEGADNYEDFLTWDNQRRNYAVYEKENTNAQSAYGEGKVIAIDKFKADPMFSDFELPKGATGVKKYKIPKGDQFSTTEGFSGNYYTDSDGNAYLPVFDTPEADKYQVVDSPEVEKSKAEQAKYEQETAGIQGWVRQTYYDNASRSNKTELVPLPNGQPVPTDGTFVPKKYPDGGTIGNPNSGAKNRAVEHYTTTVTGDKEIRQYEDGDSDYTVGTKIVDPNAVFTNRGKINTYAQLKNDVNVDFDGTLEEHDKLVKRLNRANWTGAHGFRGKNWDAGMTEEEKKAFKKENPFFKAGRSRHVEYDLRDRVNPTTETYYTQDGNRNSPQNSATFEQGGTSANEQENMMKRKVGERANAEIEHGEYVKFPDEGVQKGYGEKHSKGGIDLNIPDGTKILSNKRTISKEDIKMLKDEYGIKVNDKHTYSQVLDKYVNKIGLTKLYNEQEELFEQVDKVLKESDSEGSSRINKEYLSKKIAAIERQKSDKEKLKEALFDKMFTLQEVGKKDEKPSDIDAFFEEGGISREAFKKVVDRMGITEQEGIDLYTGKKKYPDGGTHKEPETVEEAQELFNKGLITREQADEYEVSLAGKEKIKFTTTSGEHTYSDSDIYKREKQSSTGGGFGKVTKENLPQILNELYHQFPDIVAEEYGVTYNEDGTIEFDESIDFSKASEKVKNFQERANKRMNETADIILNNPDSFSPEFVANAEAYKKNETFDSSLARGIDSKQGQFTSGRYSLGIDVITPEEQKDLAAKGIFTTKQLQTAVDEGAVELSPGSLERLGKIRELTPEGADADFALNTVTPEAAPEEAPVEPQPVPEEAPIVAPIEDSPIIDTVVPPAKKMPKLFDSPNQTPLPPSEMEAHLMNNLRLERIDPIRIGVETELQQASDSIKAGTEALSHLPPNQRAAAIVGLQANVQKGINEAIHKANITNAQNQSSAELFNIGQSGREEQARSNNLLSFEQRQLTAKANTEEEVRRYYDQLNKIHVNNFRNNQNLNLLNQLAPDYDLNTAGNQVEFNPEGEFKLQDNSKYKNLFGQ